MHNLPYFISMSRPGSLYAPPQGIGCIISSKHLFDKINLLNFVIREFCTLNGYGFLRGACTLWPR